ncbi:MAG TPA: MFS transporter [Hyphomonas sp.]|nr:MFS transporter [Hyphomonas sp.]
MLTLTYLASYMDRQVLSILIEDIGAEFHLDDVERGLLMGFAFALFYATLGVPVAFLADRANRRNIIGAAITVWSLATALCGAANGFWSLFFARMAVGVGEAGASPPAHSLISDYFRKAELTRALSVYSSGISLGAIIGLLLGGILADIFNWRIAFVAVGLPGVLLAFLVFTTIREPERGRFVRETVPAKGRSSLGDDIRSLLTNRPYLGALVAHTPAVVMGYVVVSWSAAIFARSFDLSRSEIAVLLASATFFGGVPGMFAGGVLADLLGMRDPRWRGWVPAIANLIAAPLFVFAMHSGSALGMTVWLGLGIFFYNIAFAPSFAIIQGVVAPGERALASAIAFLLANLFGLGVGPTFAGWLSDALKDDLGIRSLNYSVMYMSVVLLVSAAGFLWTAKVLGEHPMEVE